MRTTTTGVACLALLLGPTTTAVAAPAGPLECGDTVSGAVRLTHDLRCDDVGLVLEPGTVLDLDGHRLVGPGRDKGGVALRTTFGESTGGAPVVVRDGVVTGWGDVFPSLTWVEAELHELVVAHNGSVLFAMEGSLTVEDSRVVRNGVVVGGFFTTVDLARSVFVDNSTVVGTGPGGPITVDRSHFVRNGTAISCGEASLTVTRSVFRKNEYAVSSGWCGTRVELSTFVGNEYGVRTEAVGGDLPPGPDTIARNTFRGNGVAVDAGVPVDILSNRFVSNATGVLSETAGRPNEVQHLVLSRNTFLRNGDGVFIDTAAEVGRNVAVRNLGYGLYVPHAVDLGGNRAWGNGVDCVGVECGPA